MIKIVQYTDPDEIRWLAYEKDIYCIKDANERGMMDKMPLHKIPPQDINKLLEDPMNMFVIFQKENE